VVTTLRGDDVTGALYRRLPRLIMRLALWASTAVVVVSQSMHEQLIAAFPAMRKKIRFIPNGVDIVRRSSMAGPGGCRLLAVGSLIERKQFDVIIRALRRLPEVYTLTVVGDGPEAVVLTELAEQLGVNGRVTWHGNCAPEGMGDVYAHHDLLVHAARSEGRPNVVVEALAAGLPIVGANIPGVEEVLETSGGGALFPVGNDVALATTVQRLLGSPEEWSACAAAGPAWVEREALSWNVCAGRYAELFNEVSAR